MAAADMTAGERLAVAATATWRAVSAAAVTAVTAAAAAARWRSGRKRAGGGGAGAGQSHRGERGGGRWPQRSGGERVDWGPKAQAVEIETAPKSKVSGCFHRNARMFFG